MTRLATPLLVVLAAAASTIVVVAPQPAAWAKDDNKKEKDPDKERKEREEKTRRQNLADIASDFGAKDTSALLARVPRGQKLSLGGIGDATGDYSASQAQGVLSAWFADLASLGVETKSDKATVTGKVGKFPVTFRRKGAGADKSGKLYVTLGEPADGGRYTLVKLEVVM
jgi:hypothetical protein